MSDLGEAVRALHAKCEPDLIKIFRRINRTEKNQIVRGAVLMKLVAQCISQCVDGMMEAGKFRDDQREEVVREVINKIFDLEV